MDIDVLLINFLFILLPLFMIYMVFSLKKNLNIFYKKGIIILFSSFSIIMCMHYTIELAEGLYYDLRVLPFTLMVLYSGYRLGFIVLMVMLTYRFFLGGDGFFVSIILFTVILIVAGALSRRFLESSMKMRLFIPVILITIFQFGLLFNYIFHLKQDFFLSVGEWVTLIFINIVGILFVTYMIELLIKISKIQEELIKVERLKMVSYLAASISHEIKNPLSVTRGFIQLLMQKKTPVEKHSQYFNKALQEIDRADKILTDYLMFSKPKAERSEPMNLTSELENVVGLIKPLANMSGIELNMLPGDTGFIMGDRVKLHQCLLNLLKNGIESMDKGGVLVIETETEDDHYYIKIRDEGNGMTKEEVNCLGTPYFSKKENGTGLGMMVVFNIVKLMEGSIHIDSEVGKGTEIVLKFPGVKL